MPAIASRLALREQLAASDVEKYLLCAHSAAFRWSGPVAVWAWGWEHGARPGPGAPPWNILSGRMFLLGVEGAAVRSILFSIILVIASKRSCPIRGCAIARSADNNRSKRSSFSANRAWRTEDDAGPSGG
jgi:hypothetical protein